MSFGTPPDEVLHLNSKYMYLSLILTPCPMALVYAFAPYDPVAPPLVVWLVGVFSVTAIQMKRPFYPFYGWEVFTPLRTLTAEQGRVLSFLKAPEARRISLALGAIASGIISSSR